MSINVLRAAATVCVCALATVGAAAVATADGGGPQATASRSCNIDGEQGDLGASYVTSLRVKNTSCGVGKRVTKAFHKCRKKNGGRDGHCKHPVKHFKCNEGKRSGVPGVQYNAKVRCKRGSKRVVHTYTQNT